MWRQILDSIQLYLQLDPVSNITGVNPNDLKLYSGENITCNNGQIVIPISAVNDNYCDCPLDGLDEPGTSACSNGKFYCRNRGYVSHYIPSFLVGDGVCDCCDGSDEQKGVCTNQCSQIDISIIKKKAGLFQVDQESKDEL
ncbi:hypothetical protein MP228_011173 [Amoeboaphelidium protococcarum]|nr:hypothetical protein MP228_011173 [Amoeboaphelidium protococcarum]